MADTHEPGLDSSPGDADDFSPPAIEGGRIDGAVTDFRGYPLVGVRVEAAATGGGDLDLLPAMTDGQGRFVLEGLGPGRYDLRFVLGRVRGRTLGVPAGTTNLGVKLARPQGLLLIVRPQEGDAPPDLLHVVLHRDTQRGPVREYVGRHLTTRMLLWSIRPGVYEVTVWGGPWLPVSAPGIEVRENEPAPEVQLVMSARGGSLSGRVLDTDARPVPGALVAWRVQGRDGPWPRSHAAATCDAQGTFVAQGLPAATYRVSAGPPTGPFVDREVVMAGDETVEVELALPASSDPV